MAMIPQSPPGPALLRLREPLPGGEDFQVLVHPVTTIGRHGNNRLRLASKTVSRFHARILNNDSTYLVEDLGSSNGTYVNGQRIRRHSLRNGDQIIFGDCECVFYQDEEVSTQVSGGDPGELRLEPDSEASQDEVLRVRKVQGPEKALDELGRIESVPQAARFLRAHYRLLEITRQRPSQERLSDSFLELVFEVVKADRGMVLLAENSPARFRPAAVRFRKTEQDEEPFAISQTILDRCVQEQIGILSRDASRDSRFSASSSLVSLGVRSAICTPLVIRGTVLGVCYLDMQRGILQFEEADLAFVTHFASQVALALDHLRMSRERLQAEQMAVIGRTIAEVSHSIKNILALTHTGSEILERHLQAGRVEAAGKTWKSVSHGIKRMHSLVAAMLDYSRIEERDRAETCINDIVREVREDLRVEMEAAGIQLELRIEEPLPTCWLAPSGLHDALLNLIVNARDALESRPAPRITVQTAVRPGNRILLGVADNGAGIPPDILPRVFEPFFTTKGAQGNGMGLAMVRKFVNDMGGQVELESQVDAGTEIRLLFPAAGPEEDEVPAEPVQAAAAGTPPPDEARPGS